MSQLVIGTAGHIDHGKTALVKALTGTDTDHLDQEIARGMTIDLGFAFMGDSITIIDVPGHEKFIRNMVAGVSTIHLALLVIAADDGIMPQTIEHFNILKMLGINQGVIALTKCDIIADTDWLDLVEAEIEEMVAGTFLESAPIIRTSAVTGAGIDRLKAELEQAAEAVRSASDRGFFRHQVDRVFIKKGFGAVVTGTVISGQVQAGAEVEILPVGLRTKIRSLQSHGREVDRMGSGSRAAINLANVAAEKIFRGCEIVTPDSLEPTTSFIANITVLEGTSWEIKHKQRVHLHLGTAELLARISLIGRRKLRPSEQANVIIACEEQVVAACDDRFVLRSYSPMETIGGGVVLDSKPELKSRLWRTWAGEMALAPGERLQQFVNRGWRNPQTLSQWSRRLAISESTLTEFIKQNELALSAGTGLVFDPVNFADGCRAVLAYLDEFHRTNPYRRNISHQALRTALEFSGDWLELLTDSLVTDKKVLVEKGGVALAGYTIELGKADQALADKIKSIFSESGYSPPAVPELPELTGANPAKIQEMLHLLKNENQLTEILTGIWIANSVLQELLTVLRNHFKNNSELSVVDFKEITGTTRRMAIPLLEYCDNQQFTFRIGDRRAAGKAL